MKHILVQLSFIVFFSVHLSGYAYSQEQVMLLKIGGSRKLRRPPVSFPHQIHEEKILCRRCHHDYDEFGVNQDGLEQQCTECHKDKTAENPVSLLKAFHRQCKGCHEKLSLKDGSKGPVMCGQCHIRNLKINNTVP